MLNDIRLALRTLPRMPGFSLAFILTLGLGIGANTAIFSVINGVLLRPLPYPEADRIMHLRQPQVAGGVEDTSFSFAEVADYRANSRTIDQFIEFGDWTFNVLGRGGPHRAVGGLVTPNFFQLLGARPHLGRMLLPSDEGRTAQPVAVLTYNYWQRVFGSDPNIVGQILDLTVKKALIVGVLAPGSHYATTRKQDFYVNYAANDHYISASMQDERRHRMTDVYARLAPGATVGDAQAELRQIAARLHESYPDSYPKTQGFDTVVTPWKNELTTRAKPTLMILLVTTVFVLIIACANVANLTLTRLVQREREMAIRAALGARGPLLRRQLLAENLVLSVVGGVLGLGLAVAGLNLLIKYTSRFTSRTGEIALDGWVLSFTLIVSIALALVFAWAPRLGFLNDPVRAMSSGGGRATGNPGRRRAQRVLVIRDESIAPQRLNATLIGLFAFLALAIATVGVAGVLAFSVSQRRNELGIRVALGAERSSILRMILGEGAAMAGIGLLIGGIAAIPLSQLLTGLLFGVQPVDPLTIGVSAALLVTVALVAAWIPARTAMSVDPMTALRGD